MTENKLIDHFVRNYKKAEIKLEDGSVLEGEVNLGANYRRLSDLIRSNESFLILVSKEARENNKGGVFIINKNYIVWAKAED